MPFLTSKLMSLSAFNGILVSTKDVIRKRALDEFYIGCLARRLMATRYSIVHESLTQVRDLLGSAIAACAELPAELLEKDALQVNMTDAHVSIEKAMSFASSRDLCATEISLAKEMVREVLASLQDTAIQDVIDSVVTRRIATALALLHELTNMRGENDEPRTLVDIPTPLPQDLDDSQARLTVDMHEDPAHSFFTDLAGELDSVGLFVASYDLKPIGQTMALRVHLNPETILKLQGTIVWTRDYNPAIPDMRPGMGFALHNVGKWEQRAIEQYIAHKDLLYFEAS